MYPCELIIIPDQVIIALVLPKRPARPAENPIRLIAGKTFERPKPLPCPDQRSNQKVNMIGHDHERMEMVSLESALAIVQSPDNHAGDLG